MKKIALFAGLVCLAAAGCESDPRSAHIQNVLNRLNSVTSLTTQLKNDFGNLAKKDKVDPKEDEVVKTINDAIKKLKEEGKSLQEDHHKITKDIEKRVPSADDQEKYQKRFGAQLEGALKNLDRETKEMNANLDQVAAKHPDIGKEIRRSLRDASTEFQQVVGGR